MNKINTISSLHLYTAFMAGGEAIIKQKNYLNKINVFPVPDADTGTNMASTMRSIMENSKIYASIKETMNSIADSALTGARGNSGIIFAQFIHGVRQEIEDSERLTLHSFSYALKKAVHYLYDSVMEPIDGTIITVIEDWIASVIHHGNSADDFSEVLNKSYSVAEQSLLDTPKKMELLAKNNVVDAGAQGFVHFLEGVLSQIKKGKFVRQAPRSDFTDVIRNQHTFKKEDVIEYRYCTEAILSEAVKELTDIKALISKYGNSAIVAGSKSKIHFHVHTNSPGELFQEIKDFGTISRIKVDDMQKQYEMAHNKKYPIALVTDSAADLPGELIEKYQIQQIPFKISFGDNMFLDKLTLTPENFYKMLVESDEMPRSSQPDYQQIKNLYDQLTTQYDQIIATHISSKLTGIYASSMKIRKDYKDSHIHIIDTKQLSASEGLITMRIAEAIAAGMAYEEIIEQSEAWVKNSRILTDIDSLKYMVKGGRVSPLTGFIAKMINLKPIVTVDESGKGKAFGKSFSRKANMKKIINLMMEEIKGKALWNYAIVHSQSLTRAEEYAEKLTKLTGQKPAYIIDISPVVGVHNGIGSVAVTYMYDEK
ncbi:MAG: DegV family protein [Fidelibacterota bacterium]